MYKVIWGDNSNLITAIKSKYNGAYSDPCTALLVTDKEYENIENEYHFLASDYQIGDDENGYIMVDTLQDFLESCWDGMTITILGLNFTEENELNIYLTSCIEIATEAYVIENYPDHEQSVKELFASSDWEKLLRNDIKRVMLQVFLDDITSNIKSMISYIGEDDDNQ